MNIGKNRLLLVSTRLPVKISKTKNHLTATSSPGGLATGLSSIYKDKNSLWIGWPGIVAKNGERRQIKTILKALKCRPIFLSENDIKNFHQGFCNKTIWPLFHYYPKYTLYLQRHWRAYELVNKMFAKHVIDSYREGDTIWIHDYQLMLLPSLIRKTIPDAKIGFFLHIPFPSFEIFRLLPWRKELLEGILGADLIGFHTFDYAQHFLDSVHNLLGYEHTLGEINSPERIVKVDAFPMGIDTQKFRQASQQPIVKQELVKIKNRAEKQKIILSVDRLDYSKGINKRLEAFDLFLKENPGYKEKVMLILVAVPTRTEVLQYKRIKREVDELIGKINGKYSTLSWIPIWYLYKSLPFEKLCAYYQAADVCLVTPVRDGMNLIAKEYVAAKTDSKGMLILSEMAGAAKELGEAIIVNPNDKTMVSRAIKTALEMPQEQKISKNNLMQKRLNQYDIGFWFKDFLHTLDLIKSKQVQLTVKKITSESQKNIIKKFRQSKKRSFVLDYDGTLVGFNKNISFSSPDEQLLKLLQTLAKNNKNDLAIVSGRPKDILEKWMGELPLTLIAEHGAWIKTKKGQWIKTDPSESNWKVDIKPLLELFCNRTPGSFVEEKDFSLAWHYRAADKKLAEIRVKELKDTLLHLMANHDLGFLDGKKVVEIKKSSINKGLAVEHWLEQFNKNLTVIIGDDQTDEDMFSYQDNHKDCITIKVGFGPSLADYSLESYQDTRSLLKKLTKY